VAVVVDLAAVAGEVAPLEPGPVRLLVALGVAVDPPQHARPRTGEGEIPTAPLDLVAGLVDDLGADARERERGRPRLEGGDTGKGRDHDAARLRLPPRVDHRAATSADVLPVPDPGLGVDGLSD